jgi:outer membrane protein assembly factor BamB
MGLSGAVIVGGTAIAVGEHAVYAVDVATGKMLWQHARNGGPISMPAVGRTQGSDILVFVEGASAAEAAVVGVDLRTRQTLWIAPLRAISVSGVTIDGGLVLIADRAGRLYGLDLATGVAKSWSPASIGPGRVDAPPASRANQAYVVTRDQTTNDVKGVIVDELTGSPNFCFAPKVAIGTGSAITVNGGVFYIGGGAQLMVHAVGSTSCSDAWTARTRDSFSPLNGPALADGTLYVMSTLTSDSVLYALAASDGTKRWDFQLQDATIRSSPVVAGNTVYVGTDDGRVVGIDARRGVEVWEDHTGTGPIGPLAVSGDVLVASKRGRRGGLIAFEPNPGGRLLSIDSPSKLKLGRVLGGYAVALAAVFVVVFAAGLGTRRLVGVPRADDARAGGTTRGDAQSEAEAEAEADPEAGPDAPDPDPDGEA